MYSFALKGFSLLYVGVVLFINGLTLLNRMNRKESFLANLFVGIVTFLVSFQFVFSETATPDTIKSGALSFLFSLTYLWVAFNAYGDINPQKGLGYYCLFVAITAIPVSVELFDSAVSYWDFWSALSWFLWSLLWFSYFLNLVCGGLSNRFLGFFTLVIAIITAWIPGYLMVTGY